MTLNEAICHAEEVAEEKENEGKLLCQSEGASIGCLTCAEEHRQLAEWLRDYKQMLEKKYALDEEQEQIDFVRPHKRIPVTLTISSYDRLIDLANALENDDSGFWTNKKISSVLRNISHPLNRQEPCEDVISRQEAIDSIIKIHPVDTKYDCTLYDKVDVMYALKNLPSVTSQPKTGHWIKTIGENGITSAVRCSECGFEDNRYMLFRYCPNCGAKMVKSQESEE